MVLLRLQPDTLTPRETNIANICCPSQLGGAVGSNIFLAKQAPHYWLGYGLALGMIAAAIISTFILRIAYGVLNKKRDQMNEEEIRAKYTEGAFVLFCPTLDERCTDFLLFSEELLDMGDKSPLYRYVI